MPKSPIGVRRASSRSLPRKVVVQVSFRRGV